MSAVDRQATSCSDLLEETMALMKEREVVDEVEEGVEEAVEELAMLERLRAREVMPKRLSRG